MAALDPVSADLARDLLAGCRGAAARPDADDAAEALRVLPLRLRAARIEEAIGDGRHLLEEAAARRRPELLGALKQQITQLGREKADVTKAMRSRRCTGARRI